VYILLACLAGAAIALQSSMNAALGVLLRSPILATTCAFLVSGVYALILFLLTERAQIKAQLLQEVPWYLWTVGGLFSVLGVGLSYFLIPKMGIGNLMSLVLTGQLLMAMLISHFGWFDSKQISINLSKLVGVIALLIGIFLVNKGSTHG
jgi:transporter family-2 protein